MCGEVAPFLPVQTNPSVPEYRVCDGEIDSCKIRIEKLSICQVGGSTHTQQSVISLQYQPYSIRTIQYRFTSKTELHKELGVDKLAVYKYTS